MTPAVTQSREPAATTRPAPSRLSDWLSGAVFMVLMLSLMYAPWIAQALGRTGTAMVVLFLAAWVLTLGVVGWRSRR